MSDCCCGVTVDPPPPVINIEQGCVDSDTIMSHSGLITDFGCGIKPVVGEILGLQMQSSNQTFHSGGFWSAQSYKAKDTFVFGYALSHVVNEVSTTKSNPEGERFKGLPYPQSISPNNSGGPCYWIWWTKNRCLELDNDFPGINYPGCLQQKDGPEDGTWYSRAGYWCRCYPNLYQGAKQHDGNSCWNSNLLGPSTNTNVYCSNNLYYEASTKGADRESKGSVEECVGWRRNGCGPLFQDTMMGVNVVGTYTHEGYEGSGAQSAEFFECYNITRLPTYNIKYPASTIQERLSSMPFGDASPYNKETTYGKNCWLRDMSVPPWARGCSDGNGDCHYSNCGEIVANGLTPYQVRVAEERSPDIWEIHAFNDSYPIKIKNQEPDENTIAQVMIWGKNKDSMQQSLKNQEPSAHLVGYTDISAGGDNLTLIRQNRYPAFYNINPIVVGTERQVSPKESSVVVAVGSTSPDLSDLMGAEMLNRSEEFKDIKYVHPHRNFIKKVQTGFNHTVCIRENYTAEVSKITTETTGDRKYYAKSIPTVFKWSDNNDYGQIDVPFSPGSYVLKHDWVSHDPNGCPSCNNPLFDFKQHTLVDGQVTQTCNGIEVGSTGKLATGSCRFARSKSNPSNTDVIVDCSTPTFTTNDVGTRITFPGIFTQTVAILNDPAGGILPCMPWHTSPDRRPDFGTLMCQGGPEPTSNSIQYQTACVTNNKPLCSAGYPPLFCGKVAVGNTSWYVCGTGGFNDTLHRYEDYELYTCKYDPVIENFDRNYCEGIQTWSQISAGGYHNIAINKNSTFLGIDLPSNANTCANDDNSYEIGDIYSKNVGTNVVSWGAGDGTHTQSDFCATNRWPHFGQSLVPSDLGHCKQVAAGGYHSLVIQNNGILKAWGAGPYGCPTCTTQNQNNVHFGQSKIPPNISDTKFIEISAGLYHNCGIKEDGLVVCWGAGETAQPSGGICGVNWGQSIVGSTLGKCTKISCGGYHTCAIKENGRLVCWGKNTNGQCTVPGDLANNYIYQISCGLDFSAARYKSEEYEVLPYYNAHNFRSIPTLVTKDDNSSGFWPISLFRYFIAFASVEFTYGLGVTPETPGICDVNWSKLLPKTFHQRSDAVHIFSFESDRYNNLSHSLMEENKNEYLYVPDVQRQMLIFELIYAYTSADDFRWVEHCNDVDRVLNSKEYWKDRMSCKDWRSDVWKDLQTLAMGLPIGWEDEWPEFKLVRDKYSAPNLIKSLGAYRISGDKFDIRDARDNELNTSKRPPELARMATGRTEIPDSYKDSDTQSYTLQVNKDIYMLTKPNDITLNQDQQNALNRLTLSIYFRPKPIGWDYSGRDWAVTWDWPSERFAAITGGRRSYRYGWLRDRTKTNTLSSENTFEVNTSVGIGANTEFAIPGRAQSQGQPYWNTYNRSSYPSGSVSGPITILAACDIIGSQVAYSHNAHIYTARHLGAIHTKGGAIAVKGWTWYYPKHGEVDYSCSLIKLS